MKKSLGLCVGLMMIISGSVAMAHDRGGGETKVIKVKFSGTTVDANFDFEHADLSTPAGYFHGEGTSNAGKFSIQGIDELAPASDKKTCTVPGGVAGAGTPFTFVGDISVVRFTATGDLLFGKGTSGTACVDFSTFPAPPFPFIENETGDFTGGTGEFSGATGTFTVEAIGATLAIDATGVHTFGWFENTAVWTITVKEK
jgi:hypothetical protein